MTTITQTVTALPAAPDPATDNPDSFSLKAAAMVLAIKALVVELQAWTGQVNTVKGEMVTEAAGTAADAIATAADRVQTALDRAAAAASAASAAAIAGAFVGTSTTSLAIGAGNKTFTTQTGEQYTAGVWMSAVSAANNANYMIGQVVSYSGTALIINVALTGGAGTFADWNLSIAGIPGATGPTGGVASVNGVTGAVTGMATLAGTETLTNKRNTPRVGSTASSATPAINTDNYDIYQITALTAAITGFTMSGTPTEGQPLLIEITGTAARAITWGSSFEASTVALPTTTVGTAKLSVGFFWNGVTGKWRCMGVS